MSPCDHALHLQPAELFDDAWELSECILSSFIVFKISSNIPYSPGYFFSFVVKTHLGSVALLSFLCNSQHNADSRVSLNIPQGLDTSH